MTQDLYPGVAHSRMCEHCGNPISRKRLEAVPGARRCVDCQRDFDEPVRASDRTVMRALVVPSENDEEMFAPEAHE